MSQIADKPLRADARRNREKVLKAARAVFAEQGREAQIDDVARRADVGVGTVYRHFPTKDALVQALADETFEAIAAYARAALGRENAWDAFVDVLWFGAQRTAGDRAFAEMLATSPAGLPPRRCPGEVELQATSAELMRRAQAAGHMRPDVMIEDIGLLMCGIGSSSTMFHPVPEAWRRHLGIVIDGLRAEAASAPLHR